MTRTKKRGILWLTFFLFVLSGSRLISEQQGWITNSITLKINPYSTLLFSNEFRYYKITISGHYLNNWQAGFLQTLFKKFHLGLAYKRQITWFPQYILKENRFIFEAGWGTNLTQSIDFRCRFNAEIRRFEEDLKQNHLRLRLRFLLLMKLKILKLKVIPFFAFEPFFDTVTNEISENRSYTGIIFPVCKNIRLEFGYIKKDKKK